MRSQPLQEHNHPASQLSIFDQGNSAVARRSDPETSHEAAASVKNIRESHAFVKMLFRKHGPMTDEQAWKIYSRDYLHHVSGAPVMSPSGLRSRRAELTPPRGKGIRDTGLKSKTTSNRNAVVWDIDE
jgi:hypothetical protein